MFTDIEELRDALVNLSADDLKATIEAVVANHPTSEYVGRAGIDSYVLDGKHEITFGDWEDYG